MIQIRMSPQDKDYLICNVKAKVGIYSYRDTSHIKHSICLIQERSGWLLDPLHLERYSILLCELNSPSDLANFPELFL